MMLQIPSSLFSIAQDTPVLARMQLIPKNKDDDDEELINAADMDVTFFPIPISRPRPGDDDDDHAAAMVVKNCVLRYGNNNNNNTEEIHTYFVFDHEPIGCSDDDDGVSSIMIYKAVWQLSITPAEALVFNRSVALKIADNPESMAKLREEVRRSLGVEGEHRNLLRVKTCFTDEESGKFCVVMPLTHGSLRTIMHKNNCSFPELHIICVLRSLLCALSFLHTQHIFHGDINAAHIYLCNPSHPLFYHCSTITLGFAATIYEHNAAFAYDDDDEEIIMENTDTTNTNTPSMSSSSTSKWAAAPEIYYGNQPYSEKADIWLVGITALELAYGGLHRLKVTNRNALETMIKEIHDNKKLPTNIYHHHAQEEKEEEDDESMIMNKLKYYIEKWVPFSVSPPARTTTLPEVAEIVMQCLDWDPKKRPTAVDILLSHQCFNRCWEYVSDAQFYDFVITNNNKT